MTEDLTEDSLDRSGEIVEKFKLIKLIGEGGMGQVYLAQHSLTDRKVAVKILHESFARNSEILERIKREAKAAALIGHPNIVEIIDSGVDKYQAPYIAMELLDGESLEDFIDRKGALPIPVATYIISDVLETLAAAHAKGVIHRDLKPDNIFLNKKHKSKVPHIKILDFGISKFLTMDNQDLSLTKTGTIMGTPYYMSMEQALGQKIDGRSDIYSVAIILYQLLTDHLPFYDTNYNRVLIQIVSGKPSPIIELRSDIPLELSQIIDKAMQKDKDARFPDCLSFKEALEPFWNSYDPELLFNDDFEANKNIKINKTIPSQNESIPDSLLTNSNSSNNLIKTSSIKSKEIITEKTSANNNKIGFIVLSILVIIGIVLAFLLLKEDSEDLSKKFESKNKISSNKNTTAKQKNYKKTTKQNDHTIKQDDITTKQTSTITTNKNKIVQHPSEVIVTILSLPKRAKIYYDGKKIKHPLKIKYDNHFHTIIIKAQHKKTWVQKIKPEGNLTLKYSSRSSNHKNKNHHSKPISIKPIKDTMKPKPIQQPMKPIENVETPDF